MLPADLILRWHERESVSQLADRLEGICVRFAQSKCNGIDIGLTPQSRLYLL